MRKEKGVYRYINNGSCIPFSRRILMTVNNKLFPCERIGHDSPLGYIQDDNIFIDSKAIKRYSMLYNDVKHLCTQCYQYKNCPTCIYCEIRNNASCPNFTNYSQVQKNLQNIFPFLKPIVAFIKKMLNPYKYYKYENKPAYICFYLETYTYIALKGNDLWYIILLMEIYKMFRRYELY